jgi:peptidoglycan DL-endopeptidase CwlO
MIGLAGAGLATKVLIAFCGLVLLVAVFAGASGATLEFMPGHADASAGRVCAYASELPRPADRPQLNVEQQANARVIIDVAAELGLQARAAVVGVATAITESDLDRETMGDHGRAYGLFPAAPRVRLGHR